MAKSRKCCMLQGKMEELHDVWRGSSLKPILWSMEGVRPCHFIETALARAGCIEAIYLELVDFLELPDILKLR